MKHSPTGPSSPHPACLRAARTPSTPCPPPFPTHPPCHAATKWIHTKPFRPEWLDNVVADEMVYPEDCVDNEPACVSWAENGARMGAAVAARGLRRELCPACAPSPPTRQPAATRAAPPAGECENNAKFMRGDAFALGHCRRSCNDCEVCQPGARRAAPALVPRPALSRAQRTLRASNTHRHPHPPPNAHAQTTSPARAATASRLGTCPWRTFERVGGACSGAPAACVTPPSAPPLALPPALVLLLLLLIFWCVLMLLYEPLAAFLR